MYIQNCVIISFIFVGVYLIFTSFFLKFCFTAYYYEFRGGPPEYCLTRQDLINRINHFEFQYVLLPTIWIDEDLELSCNELPATWIPAMTRKSQNPYYSIKSFQSNQTYTFTLDTSNCESDNCPGFAFENIKLNLKGNNLNTTAFYINKNVNISIENDDFSLNVDIAKLTMFQLSLFSKFSFSQLTLEDNLEDFSLDDESNQTLPEKNYKFGNIYIENSFCEPNYLYFPVLLDTNVTFAEDYLYIEMNERSDLVIHLPIFDYSNGFYFNIQKSNINFFVQGNINYSCQFPHSFYLIQNKESKNLNISIGKGNFLSTVGIFYDDSSGSLFSTTLHDCNLYYYNENKIDSLSLYNVQFYAYTSIEIESTFTFSGNIPVQTNLNLSCSYINVINSDYEFSQLMAVKGKNINVTVNYINSCSHIIGDVYLRKGIKVPNSASSITIQNLYFIDHPAVELSYLWGSNSECPINITGNIFGNANIVPMTSTKEFIKYICGNAVDESFFNISYIGTTIQHIPFEILKIDNCIVTNQTSAKPAESIVICFDGPSNKCPKTYNVLPENDDDWSIYYTPYLTKIEFNMMRDVMIDLSVIKHELSVIFQPYVPIFQVSPGYDVKIASSQRAANYILNWQLGSTTVANVMTITFMNYLSMKNIITIQKSLKYDPKNFKMMLDFYELTYLAIEYMSQINDLSDILPSIPCLIVNS